MKLLILLPVIISAVSGARILCFFYFPSISHQYVFRQIAKSLSTRGHEVTFVTPDPIKNPKLTNLTEIDVSVSYDIFKRIDATHFNPDELGAASLYISFNNIFEEALKEGFSSEGLRQLLQRDGDSFDLILIEAHNPIPYGLQHKFKAPLIAVSSCTCLSEYQNVFGNSIHPVLYTDVMYSFSNPIPTIMDKLESLYFTAVQQLVYELSIYPGSDSIARQYFGEDMPHIKDLVKNASLLMLNINPILSNRRPNAPNVIEFFNIHDLRREEVIEEDLQRILDNATEGVVYFSLGTNVRFDHVQGDLKKSILDALGDLPYTVLCKWESDSVPDQPKNVHLRTWFPQQAILAHPNLKVFVTQGGLQSAEEAIINAVPLVVIPFLVDQPLNARHLTSNGIAETISPKVLSREILTQTIMNVAKDPKYQNRAKEVRAIFLDQPQSGIEKVIWWCEYVIRHKGAKHLRSPAADLPLYEYFMLDVLAVVLIFFYIVYKVIHIIYRTLLSSFGKAETENHKYFMLDVLAVVLTFFLYIVYKIIHIICRTLLSSFGKTEKATHGKKEN